MVRLSALVLLALAIVPAAPSARAQGLTSSLEMTGRAVIEAPADVVRIELSAYSEEANACEALAADAGLAVRLADALGDLGVTEADIETSDFRFATARQPDNPMANPPGNVETALLDPEPAAAGPNAGTGPALACGPSEIYRVDSAVSIVLRSLDGLDAALDRLGRMEGIKVEGLRHEVAQTDDLFARARRAALEDAEAKAAAYAASMNLSLNGPLRAVPGPVQLIGVAPPDGDTGASRVAAQASVRLFYEVSWD